MYTTAQLLVGSGPDLREMRCARLGCVTSNDPTLVAEPADDLASFAVEGGLHARLNRDIGSGFPCLADHGSLLLAQIEHALAMAADERLGGGAGLKVHGAAAVWAFDRHHG